MRRSLGLATAILFLFSGTATALPPLSRADIKAFLDDTNDDYHAYTMEPLESWRAALRSELASHTPDQTADLLAARYGMSTERMRALIGAWVPAKVHTYDSLHPAAKAAMRSALLGLFAGPSREPLVIEAAAEALDGLSDCEASDFATMMKGSPDPAGDAWLISNAAACGDNFVRAAAVAPDRAMPALIRLADYGSLGTRDALPLAQWLTSPAALARIAESDRPAMTALLVARYTQLLFKLGLTERAVVLLDGLSPELRRRVLDPSPLHFTAKVDGLAVSIDEKRSDGSLQLNLVTAYALAGRTADAEALLASTDAVAVARRRMACLSEAAPKGGKDCGSRSDEAAMEILVLDHFLHQPADDPYPLAELLYAGSDFGSAPLMMVELRCRVFADVRFGDLCADSRKSAAYGIEWHSILARKEEAERAESMLSRIVPGFVAGCEELDRVMHARWGDALESETDHSRPTITPEPAPFAETPLPDAYRGPRPARAAWPKSVSTLPDGYLPIRLERSGQRAVAISLSHTYDPTGEVSQGGYWVHLSADGGAHWEKPLYTGLADRFPYIVPASSRMPLIDGDAIDLEVEVDELDTASITYPPVALRSRRRATGLYLRMPLAALRRDGDGDGISDIAAHHLILDHARTDGGTPFLVGSDPATDCRAASPERALRIGILTKLFGVHDGALVEPLERKRSQIGAVASGSGAAADRPIFVEGAAAEYRCLQPDRKIIVYGKDDLIALRHFSPDFHALTMPKIVFNRTRDRGYFKWSLGWTGGTYRVRLVNRVWQFDSISQWIT